jgi:uncharacterized membrane protein
MRIRLESAKRIGNKIGLNEDKGFAVAIFLALIIVSATVIGYYVWLRPPAESHNNIYLLDANRKAVDYPEVLVVNQNSTFSVYVGVENHMNGDQNYQVRTKITGNLPSTFPQGVQVNPINTYDFTLVNDASHQNLVTVTENEAGSYSVVFELWRLDSRSYVFTQEYCVLNVQVIN